RIRDYDTALEMVNLALNKDPQYFQAYLNRGVILTYLKRYEDALKDFEKAIELRPNNPAGYFNTGRILDILGRTDKALEVLKEGADLGNEQCSELIKIIESRK
ncbi:MAG TPA: tetratricopeptide repeat protein, partial [Firmicutes bacterium]|nr:tetratricopeptide repeat protein [Bacillota bacterium]